MYLVRFSYGIGVTGRYLLAGNDTDKIPASDFMPSISKIDRVSPSRGSSWANDVSASCVASPPHNMLSPLEVPLLLSSSPHLIFLFSRLLIFIRFSFHRLTLPATSFLTSSGLSGKWFRFAPSPPLLVTHFRLPLFHGIQSPPMSESRLCKNLALSFVPWFHQSLTFGRPLFRRPRLAPAVGVSSRLGPWLAELL